MADSKDYQKLAQKLLVSAQNGDAKSQYQLAVLYNDGKGVEKNYTEAAKWYLMAAKQGHQKAQLYLGLLLINGKGVPKNYKQAAQWLAKSAQQGEQKFQYYLGMLYYKGAGVEKNLDNATLWLKLSANQGNKDAQKLLDEIMTLDMPVLDDIDNDDDINAANDMPKEQPRRSKSGIFLAAVLFAVVLFAGAGAVYYFLNGRNFEHDIIQFDAGNIDVFKLAAYGSPKQLKEAVKHGAIFNVEWNMLDTHGADTEESIFESGETPLHRAASLNRNPESIKFLISQGLDVNAWATAGTMLAGTPLYCAVVHGNTEAARELLKAGADPNAYSASGNMLQILACSDNNPSSKSIAELLIKYGANVNGHNETDRKRNMIKPRSSWTSEKPFENILDDVYDGDVRVFIASSVPLTLAVLYDNPEMVDWLLDEKADPNISNIEGRIAMHYAEEFPDDSKMKRSKAFRRLKAATEKSIKQNVTSAKDYESAKYLNDLLALKKVPDYIRNKGSFFCNPDFLKSGGVVEIKNAGGANVNMRSQPNMQARIITQLNENRPADFPMYAGEWTNLNGERWVMTQYFDDSTKDIETAWIFGKYTGIMTGEEYAVLLDGIVEAEAESGVENDSLIDAVRNSMYYSSYPR